MKTPTDSEASLAARRRRRGGSALRRAACSLAVVMGLLLSTAALAAEKRQVLVVLPPSAPEGEGRELAMLIQAKASAVLATTGKYAIVDLKQVLSALSLEGMGVDSVADQQTAERAGKFLGADLLVYGGLENTPKGWKLSFTATDFGRNLRLELTVGNFWASAVDAGATSIAQTMMKLEGVKGFKTPVVPPTTSNNDAMKAYGKCFASVIRQPLGVENPAVLDAPELEAAVDACEKSLAADPKFGSAAAALALAHAIQAKDIDAVKLLGPLPPAELESSPGWLARFWLVTRYQENDKSVELLKDTIAKRPGFLLAYGYLGELLDTLGRHEEAEAAWKQYLEVSPRDPFVKAKLAKSMARQGKYEEAIKLTQEAAKSAKSNEVQLQLASRYVDAAKWDDAAETLKPLVARPESRGEVLLRYGYVLLNQNKLDEAEKQFVAAIQKANKPSEWRTQARAQYDLAIIHAKRKQDDKAEKALKVALLAGFRTRDLAPELVPIAKKMERGDLTKDKDGKPIKLTPPKESSLFPVDKFGAIDTSRPKERPPDGFMLVHF